MTTLIMRKVINGGVPKMRLVEVGPKKLIGGGLLKLERVKVICPACGEQVEAVASDGRAKGYCAVAKQFVDFPIETQLAPQSVVRIGNLPTAETGAKLSASAKKLWQDPEYRAKQIATHTGKHPTAKTKAKISAALKRRYSAERGANEDK
ncbi:hypothetical protein ES703_41873 [subsurface metagenome]